MGIRRMAGRKESNLVKRRIWGCVTGCLLAVTGCAGTEPDDDNLIIMEQESQKPQYTLGETAMGDVVLTEHISCTYLQTAEEDISFSVSGRQIAKIHVRVGDSVVKGQLLAELTDNNTEGRIEELEYNIERNRLLMEYVDVKENQDISAKWLQFLYRSGLSDEEEEALKDSVSRLQQDNVFLRQDYQDAIDLDSMELEKLRSENAAGQLYAGMDGTVSWIMQNAEGSTCVRNEKIMKIIDGSDGLFVVKDVRWADKFQEGVPVDMKIPWGSNAGQYQLIPYKMEEWDERLTFTLEEQYEGTMIEVGTDGTIDMVLDSRENVITVPLRAVHMAEERFYVYVVGESGMREVRWIETGLHGDTSVEIREGLTLGEKVILK